MIEDYLRKTFGLEVRVSPFPEKLPAYLTERRTWKILTIEGFEYALVEYEPGAFNLPQWRKQLKKMRELHDIPVIIVLSEISAYQRRILIEEHQAFMVPGKQLYAPALGMQFQRAERSALKGVDVVSFTTQLILTAYILGKLEDGLTQKEIAERLRLVPMSVSRAVKELTSVDLIRTEKVGRSVRVHPRFTGKELFDEARSVMRAPINRRSVIYAHDLPQEALISGESALAERTMLSDPPLRIYAVKAGGLGMVQRLDPEWIVDPAGSVMVEEWPFDPRTLASGNTIDPVSLILIMQEVDDERVEMALDEFTEEVFE